MSDYEKSNAETSVKYERFDKSFYSRLIKCNNSERYQIANEILSYLCKKYKIHYIKLEIKGQRPIVRSGEIHGKYNHALYRIIIYNRTARRGELISIKQFFDTLIHEFMHHYDYEVLNLYNSNHTQGFYKRINDLKEKLIS